MNGYPNLAPPMTANAPLGQATGGQMPQSQLLAQALQSMGSRPQGSAMGLDSNLLAQALMMYGAGRNPNSGSTAVTPNDGTGGLGGPINPATGQPWGPA